MAKSVQMARCFLRWRYRACSVKWARVMNIWQLSRHAHRYLLRYGQRHGGE